MTSPKSTPMMAQWTKCKDRVGEALLLFRLGDFYEAFGEDARIVSQALDLTLTKRQDTPMCGIPWHSSDGYIDRLLVKGFSVAIAEQVGGAEDAKIGSKTLMDRQIVRVLTPGTAMKGSLIQDSSHSLLVCVSLHGGRWGAACVDVTTALFHVFEVDGPEELVRELSRIRPKELICASTLRKQEPEVVSRLEEVLSLKATSIPSWTVDLSSATTIVTTHFKTHSVDGFGLRDLSAATCAAGAVLCYLKETLLVPVTHLKSLEVQSTKSRMVLDRFTLSNLDIFESSSSANGGKSLFDIINGTKTPMGARLLRSWLLAPLTNLSEIRERHDLVASCIEFLENEKASAAQALHALTSIRDIERLILRIQTGSAGPRDVLFLAHCAVHIKPLQLALQNLRHPILGPKLQSLSPLEPLVERIRATITEEPPLRVSDGGSIRDGVSAELDELRQIQQNSHQWLVGYQSKLREELGIKTLKVGYTRAFGYYIEVSRGQTDRVPSTFCRRQTLTGVERYISEELKQFEDKVLTAEKRIEGLETALFDALKEFVTSFADAVIGASRVIAEVDCFLALSQLAISRSYCRPEMVSDPVLSIVGGRHPIAETQVQTAFVPNNLDMSAEGPSLLLITGPNMAGKSTFVRQAALLVILAQIGSYVPASKATIGVVDRVFSRVGASDDLFRGQSTFMVEMTETASILNQATPHSLVLLDEIGRGTSTYDGISIAWAVVEYLIRFPRMNPRTLFATHYYELTELEQQFPTVKNMTVAVSEEAHGIRFLYTVVPGKTDRSYGIHVAKLAGLPESVISRASSVLGRLEEQRPRSTPTFVPQDLFTVSVGPTVNDPNLLASYEFLRDLDLVKISPMDCFLKLVRFKKSNSWT
jgi:DNA mismatch repair protein MutS